MIYIGNNEISNIYIGTNEIYGIYAGDLQIYPTDFGIVTAISLENLVWVEDVPRSGGTADSGNCSFSVIAYYDSGKRKNVTHDATISGSLVVPEATADTREMVGTLTLTATYSGFTATGSVDVYQAASFEPSKEPLTFNILSAGTIIWKASSASIAKTIDYKLNNGEWTSITSNTGSSAPTITVNSGDKVQFRGNNAQYATDTSAYNSFSGSTASFDVEGNIMSLIYGDDFVNNLTISSTYAFTGLFKYCAKLVSTENLILPANTLANNCYQYMFDGCTSLTTAPELPARTLANACYQNMFKDCSSLTTAPELPATTLKYGCYYGMFQGCTSLTTAPELPATTLTSGCYQYMFYYCTSLATAPALPATTLADYCYSHMLERCTSLTTAPELPATTLKNSCYDNMFYGCKSLTTAPELPATTLDSSCYSQMFQGCTSLTTAPSILPATTLKVYCYSEMFKNCTSLITVPSNLLPATTLAQSCYRYMFKGCSKLTTAPELPATTLATSCYYNMFYDCTSLNYIKCLATDISATNCTSYWVSGVASTGTFVKNPNMASWTTGFSGIPTGWTVENNS